MPSLPDAHEIARKMGHDYLGFGAEPAIFKKKGKPSYICYQMTATVEPRHKDHIWSAVWGHWSDIRKDECAALKVVFIARCSPCQGGL